MKRIFAALLTMVILFAFVACNSDKQNEDSDVLETTVNSELLTDKENNDTSAGSVTETESESDTDTLAEETSDDKENISDKDSGNDEKTTNKVTTADKKDPSNWSKAEVVAFYKAACEKSAAKKSVQTMSMRKNTLKAAGGVGNFLSMAEPIIRNVLKLNSTEIDGITGGYNKLVPSDCKSAKAYKSGNYTVVEMKMVDQIDGVYGKKAEGTVGHAIFVVDGVAEAVEQFPAFDIRYKEADIKIYYTDAIVKVKINSNGVIEKGTWSYVTEPVINGLYIENLEVNNAGAVIDYKVTVGGGF